MSDEVLVEAASLAGGRAYRGGGVEGPRGAIAGEVGAERGSDARLHVRQAIAGLLDAAERRTDGFHMLSLAAKDALCCRYNNYVMVGDGTKGVEELCRPAWSFRVPKPQLRIRHLQACQC